MVRNVLLAFMICNGVTLVGGYSNMMSHTGGKGGTYPDIRAGAIAIGDDEINWGTRSLVVLDVPFTAILDIILLPWDVFRGDGSVRSRVERSETNTQVTSAAIPPVRTPDN